MHTNLGHRERVRKRFRDEGLTSFDETHALELLLFYAVPRKDTKPLARRLLDYFGSFNKVLEADIRSLQKVEGVGVNVATYLHLINEVGKYYEISRDKPTTQLGDLNSIGQYLVKYFRGVTVEQLYLLCFDAKNCVICCQKLGEGTNDSVDLSSKRIVDIVISIGAQSVVLAHNHPGGFAIPSNADIVATHKLCAILASLDVRLLDHVIVSDGDFVSLYQTGKYTPEKYSLALL